MESKWAHSAPNPRHSNSRAVCTYQGNVTIRENNIPKIVRGSIYKCKDRCAQSFNVKGTYDEVKCNALTRNTFNNGISRASKRTCKCSSIRTAPPPLAVQPTAVALLHLPAAQVAPAASAAAQLPPAAPVATQPPVAAQFLPAVAPAASAAQPPPPVVQPAAVAPPAPVDQIDWLVKKIKAAEKLGDESMVRRLKRKLEDC